MKANSPWVFLPLVGFVLLAVLLASGLGRDPQELPSALVGKPVPTFSLSSLLTEETFTEESLRGRWQLLNVWATWCPTCHVEHPYLLELAARGIPIAGLNYKDETPAARQYLADLGNPFTHVIVDADGQLGLDLGVYGAPETFLINPQGEIVLRHAGDLNERVWQEKFVPLMPAARQGGGA
ncbi:MAG: DsbE family thiol:disulfide interchange protein [Pseudomonadales bacterium]|nr:DsbE family thiol:disulfide interchange protein [Pseudomonadales bacterium]